MSYFRIPPAIAFALLATLAVATATAAESMPVSVVRIVRATIADEVTLTGNLQARRVSRLSAEVDGIVDNLLVDEGDRVDAGQIVLTLNDDLATIATTRAAAEIDEARARRDEAQRRYSELTELARRQHVPQTNVEAARAEIDMSLAVLAQARAEHRRTQALLERHTVRAPFDGVASTKYVEIGQWVDTSSPLIELVETTHLRLQVPVPQFYFSRVTPGTKVAVRFDSLPEQVFEAAVTTVIPVSDNAARTFPVRIDFANATGKLAPGMSARAVLQIADEDEPTALIVPRDAIVRRPDGTETVWTVKSEDGVAKADPHLVTTGRVYRDNVEILGGDLEPGAPVIVRGNEILQPGQPVTIAQDSPMDL